MKTKFSRTLLKDGLIFLVIFIGAGGFAEAAAPGRKGRPRRKN